MTTKKTISPSFCYTFYRPHRYSPPTLQAPQAPARGVVDNLLPASAVLAHRQDLRELNGFENQPRRQGQVSRLASGSTLPPPTRAPFSVRLAPLAQQPTAGCLRASPAEVARRIEAHRKWCHQEIMSSNPAFRAHGWTASLLYCLVIFLKVSPAGIEATANC